MMTSRNGYWHGEPALGVRYLAPGVRAVLCWMHGDESRKRLWTFNAQEFERVWG